MNNPFESIATKLDGIREMLLQISDSVRPVSEKKYYTISETAEKLNVAEITVYRQVKAGKIPSKRIGSRVLVPGSYVENVK